MFLVQRAGASFIILSTRNLDHISVAISVFTFLLQDKLLKELIQDTVSHQEIYYISAAGVDDQGQGRQQPPLTEQPKRQKETAK